MQQIKKIQIKTAIFEGSEYCVQQIKNIWIKNVIKASLLLERIAPKHMQAWNSTNRDLLNMEN